MAPAIETRDLVKRFGRTTALDGLSMSVPKGEVFGFLGPNGAGKTTAVKILLGLVAPTAGSASVLGLPAGDLGTRRRIGYLPELFRYQPWLTGRELLVLHADLAAMPGDRRRAADEAL
jgi:ABC-2 type transport system ATP-binding protein